MKKQIRTLVLCGSILTISATAWAGVVYSVDSSTTTSSSAFPGTPALTLAVPSQGNVYEGGGANGGVEGIAFLATSSFNLGAIEYQWVGGYANISVSLYDLGTSFVPASGGGAAQYTIDGSSVNLLSAGLNFSAAAATDTFGVLTFSGADQVALTSGHWYSLELLNNDLVNTVLLRRASTGYSSFLALGSGATGTRVNVPAGDRDPVAAVYAAVIPEPSTMTLLGLGALAGLVYIRRRKV